MEPSSEVVDAVLRFYAGASSADRPSFDDVVSKDPSVLVIGTAPGEWVADRERLRRGFDSEGTRVDAGPAPFGYRQGDAGWVVDEPTFHIRGSPVRARLTAVVRLEDGEWKIVHLHVSVGVPDADVVELQQRWSEGT
jgi:SnoaL-like domain